FLHRAPGVVHVGGGLEQDYALAIERAFRSLALKAAAPWSETMTPRNFINGHEADIVPVTRVSRTGIAEADKEQHDAASRVNGLLLLGAATGSGRLGASRGRCRSTSRGRSRAGRRSRGTGCGSRSTRRRRRSRTKRSAFRGSGRGSRSRLLLFG